MKFLVDESTGKAVVDFLKTKGHDVIFVSESMPQADDQAILKRAMADKRILITNDKDFGELVFRIRQTHSGVVLLRLRDDHPSNRVGIVKILLEKYTERLMGNFSVATEKEIRIRTLPG